MSVLNKLLDGFLVYEPNLKKVLILDGPQGLQLTEWVIDVNLPYFEIRTTMFGVCRFKIVKSDLGPDGYVTKWTHFGKGWKVMSNSEAIEESKK